MIRHGNTKKKRKEKDEITKKRLSQRAKDGGYLLTLELKSFMS